MDEFNANNIMSASKVNRGLYSQRKLQNVIQIKWEIQLEGYRGKLTLEINYCEDNEIRLSLNETYDNVCLRRLEVPLNRDKVYNHRNPEICGNTQKLEGIHKHRYLDRVKDGCAYVPNDIDTTSLQSIIRTFAKECNITLTGDLPKIVDQKRLF
jgi:hypothetical protein